ncbi:MAG: hypothetical protein D3925_14900 [Candidatus Electrothrix sp. AR5]|nr:hypothetical protein [Candidatus Electrothrix sp. AR5]
MCERYFYHSFPRRHHGATREEVLSKGLKILDSIVESGLILTPEKTDWFEFLTDGNRSKPVEVVQKRVCFTELSPSELPRHSDTFGEFALEFSIETLRCLGGSPVFYLPSMSLEETSCSGMSGALICRMLEIQELLTRLKGMDEVAKSTTNKSELLSITRNGVVTDTTRCTAGGAEDLLAMLQSEMQPISVLLGSLQAISGFFYPTEDLKRNKILHYYRQREWRIIANGVWRGENVCDELSESEIKTLLDIDTDFFGKEMDFPTGRYTIARQSRKLKSLAGKHVLQYLKRLIVPEEAISRAKSILDKKGISIPVEHLAPSEF